MIWRPVTTVTFVLFLGMGAHGAEIRLENAADGSGELTLAAGQSGQINIVLVTSPDDTIVVAFLAAFLDDDEDDELQITAVTDRQDQPFEYDRGSFELPCGLSMDQGNEYGLIMGYDQGGFPLGEGTYLLDTLTVFNPGTPCELGDILVTFELGSRKPYVYGPAPTFLPFTTTEACPDTRPLPNSLYMGIGNGGTLCPDPFIIHASPDIIDCNANGSADCEDVNSGLSPDCNGNDVPDECDLSSGSSIDCQENGVPDECEGIDCNASGVPDECDIASGNSADCQRNGVPDECEPECNGNGIPDECDLSTGASEDCDGDGVPDECRLAPSFAASSGQLSPIGLDYPQTFTITPAPPPAEGYVTLAFTGFGDFAHDLEFVDVTINGLPVGSVFADGGHDCPDDPDADLLVVLAETYNVALTGEPAVITMTASEYVLPFICVKSYITVSIDYETGQDCNGNAIPDGCDIADGSSADVNTNGVPDECDSCAGDVNGDGTVDPLDSGFVLSRLGCAVGTGNVDCDSSDQNVDATVDPLDVGYVLSRFGECR